MLRYCGTNLIMNSCLRSNLVMNSYLMKTRNYTTANLVEVCEKDGVREIVLCDAKTRNSLSLEMMDALLKCINSDSHNEKLRAVILSAKGPVWSAGHNLKELTIDHGCPHILKLFNVLPKIIDSIQKLPVPVIAKVDGLAAAAGCQLVASCDIVVASDRSKFSTPGGHFGIFCSTPGIAIARTMPRLKSAYMLFTGLPISAQEAYVAGLVSSVVPESELDCEITKITNAIKNKSRAVVTLGKEFFYQQLQMSLKDAYKAGAEIMTENVSMEDGQEGINSFIEKRKPKWNNK